MLAGSEDLNLEKVVEEKSSVMEEEKLTLGLSPPPCHSDDQENASLPADKPVTAVAFQESEKHYSAENKTENDRDRSQSEKEMIPPDLDRHIRRYIGLPSTLKVGEYSPNNPLMRSVRIEGDALLGLGEFERRHQALRRMRQQQYRDYLDSQAKTKQEEKEKAEKERRDREERERSLEEQRAGPRLQAVETEVERTPSMCYGSSANKNGAYEFHTMKLDAGSQTDDFDLYKLPSPSKMPPTQAERELSPRTEFERCDEGPVQPAWSPCELDGNRNRGERDRERPRSYGDFDERPAVTPSRKRLLSDLRHTQMSTMRDAETIRLLNLQVEQESAARRLQYQEELRNQIKEKERIREERRTKEKILEQAELRRLEDQLRLLKAAQEKEQGRHHDMAAAIKETAAEYDSRRINLQKEIDYERSLLRTFSQPTHAIVKWNTSTCHSDSTRSHTVPAPFSNFPENSLFSNNYDVDSYLRKNLNPSNYFNERDNKTSGSEILVKEKALVHDCPKENILEKPGFSKEQDCPKENVLESPMFSNEIQEKKKANIEKPRREPSFLKKNLDEITKVDETPISAVKHLRKIMISVPENDDLSDQMKKIYDKWKVPAVQKKSVLGAQGNNDSILTQLGSMRRQLQLEQLQLDNNILPKSDV